MAFTSVQSANGRATNTQSWETTLPAAPTRGNLVVVGLMWYDGTAISPLPVTVSDVNGNPYTVDPTFSNESQDTAGFAGIAYMLSAPANAAAQITVTWSRGATVTATWAREFSVTAGNFAAVKSLGQGASGSAAPTDAPRLVASAGDLCFAQIVTTGTAGAATSPWTVATEQDGNNTEYILNATQQHIVGFASDGGTWNIVGMVFTEGKKRFLVL
jgi:hypothetical protein